MTEASSTPELEEWESVVRGTRGITRYSEKGERSPEIVPPGSIFHITPDERRRNQQRVRDKAKDPFSNGAFRLRTAVDSDANSVAAKKISEKGAKADDDLQTILETPFGPKFTAKIDALSGSVAFERLYRLAREQEVGAKKIDMIGARLKELDPDVVLVGEKLGVGAENPDDPGNVKGPAVNVDAPGAPQTYPNLD